MSFIVMFAVTIYLMIQLSDILRFLRSREGVLGTLVTSYTVLFCVMIGMIADLTPQRHAPGPIVVFKRPRPIMVSIRDFMPPKDAVVLVSDDGTRTVKYKFARIVDPMKKRSAEETHALRSGTASLVWAPSGAFFLDGGGGAESLQLALARELALAKLNASPATSGGEETVEANADRANSLLAAR